MEARLQRRIQRYGWDLAAADYEPLWQRQLAPALAELLWRASLQPDEKVLDVACGTGLVSFDAARAVGLGGSVTGVDISEQMVARARRRALAWQVQNARFIRMGAEQLELPDGCFDVALCSLGLMYIADAAQAMREMRRVLRPGGRMIASVWGERVRCGWAPLFPIIDAEVNSEVCPLFFNTGRRDTLAQLCLESQFDRIELRRVATTLNYASADEAFDAAFIGGPVALAWSRFDQAARERVRVRYMKAIAPWRSERGYQIPGEFVVVAAVAK